MARSVSRPSGAILVAYAAFSCDDEDDAYYEFQSRIEVTRDRLQLRYPSLVSADRWLGNEDHIIAENAHCMITVSEYCGLVAVCVVPKDGPLADAWSANIKRPFLNHVAASFGDVLVSRGTFSNGEQMFAPLDGQQRGAMGLGYTSKEGWL